MSLFDFLSRKSITKINVSAQNMNSEEPVINQDLTPEILVTLNRGWVAICNSYCAQSMASVPLKLYYHNKTAKKLQLTPTKELTTLKSLRLSKQLNIQLKQNQKVEEILEHPLLEMLTKVNSTQNKTDLVEIIGQYLGILGNSYVRIVTGSEGIPVELQPLLSEYVNIEATGKKEGQVLSYIYEPPETKKQIFSPEEIIHFVNYVPGNMIVGKGELSNCLSAAYRMNAYDVFEEYMLKNKSVPDSVWDFTKPLSENEKKDIVAAIRKKYSGNNNSGKPIVLNGNDLKITELGKTPRDMQYQTGRTWAREEIAAAFKIPLPLLTVTDVNRANAVMGNNFYLKHTIFPKMSKLCSKLNEQLLPLYGQEGLYVWFSEDEVLEINDTDVISAFTSGIITQNEARSSMGYEPVEINEKPSME